MKKYNSTEEISSSQQVIMTKLLKRPTRLKSTPVKLTIEDERELLSNISQLSYDPSVMLESIESYLDDEIAINIIILAGSFDVTIIKMLFKFRQQIKCENLTILLQCAQLYSDPDLNYILNTKLGYAKRLEKYPTDNLNLITLRKEYLQFCVNQNVYFAFLFFFAENGKWLRERFYEDEIPMGTYVSMERIKHIALLAKLVINYIEQDKTSALDMLREAFLRQFLECLYEKEALKYFVKPILLVIIKTEDYKTLGELIKHDSLAKILDEYQLTAMLEATLFKYDCMLSRRVEDIREIKPDKYLIANGLSELDSMTAFIFISAKKLRYRQNAVVMRSLKKEYIKLHEQLVNILVNSFIKKDKIKEFDHATLESYRAQLYSVLFNNIKTKDAKEAYHPDNYDLLKFPEQIAKYLSSEEIMEFFIVYGQMQNLYNERMLPFIEKTNAEQDDGCSISLPHHTNFVMVARMILNKRKKSSFIEDKELIMLAQKLSELCSNYLLTVETEIQLIDKSSVGYSVLMIQNDYLDSFTEALARVIKKTKSRKASCQYMINEKLLLDCLEDWSSKVVAKSTTDSFSIRR